MSWRFTNMLSSPQMPILSTSRWLERSSIPGVLRFLFGRNRLGPAPISITAYQVDEEQDRCYIIDRPKCPE
jgi:hypothetical protein